jgi:hypothetical protein
MLKCALCGQNHSANFSQCAKRLEFVERQQRYRNNTQRRERPARPVQQAFVAAPQLENFVLPSLNPRTRANRIPQNVNQATIDNDLFTPNQLMVIFKELMAAISRATTKSEQISALGEIAIKYCSTQRR